MLTADPSSALTPAWEPECRGVGNIDGHLARALQLCTCGRHRAALLPCHSWLWREVISILYWYWWNMSAGKTNISHMYLQMYLSASLAVVWWGQKAACQAAVADALCHDNGDVLWPGCHMVAGHPDTGHWAGLCYLILQQEIIKHFGTFPEFTHRRQARWQTFYQVEFSKDNVLKR